jgi:hypothetical protein
MNSPSWVITIHYVVFILGLIIFYERITRYDDIRVPTVRAILQCVAVSRIEHQILPTACAIFAVVLPLLVLIAVHGIIPILARIARYVDVHLS